VIAVKDVEQVMRCATCACAKPGAPPRNVIHERATVLASAEREGYHDISISSVPISLRVG
jgi:hypothetical protein